MDTCIAGVIVFLAQNSRWTVTRPVSVSHAAKLEKFRSTMLNFSSLWVRTFSRLQKAAIQSEKVMPSVRSSSSSRSLAWMKAIFSSMRALKAARSVSTCLWATIYAGASTVRRYSLLSRSLAMNILVGSLAAAI